MAATMTQLNVRVNTEQRRQAEEVLGLMGESLTKLIRGVLEKVSQGVEEAEEVYGVLKGTPSEEMPLTNRASRVFERVDSHYHAMAESLGVDVASFTPLTDEELEEALYDERLSREAERVAWHA